MIGRFYAFAFLWLIFLKSTSLLAQGLSEPVHFYGLWEGFHPIEIILDDQGNGSLILADQPFPIKLKGQQEGDRWKIHEILPEGSISGEWIISPLNDHWLGEWINYNQSSGSLCVLFDSPVEVPGAFSVRFYFKDKKKRWSFTLFPLPRGKWKGIAWEASQGKLVSVTGEWRETGILLSLDDPDSGKVYELHFLTDRQAWRTASWSDQSGNSSRVHLRRFRTDPVKVTAFLDFSREILLLEPDLDWPSWASFIDFHLQTAQTAFEEEYHNMLSGVDGQVPFQRHAIRLYSWVDWSYLDRKMASGTLHIAGSWGPPQRIPFAIHRKDGIISLSDLWPEGAIPEDILVRLPGSEEEQPLRLDPFALYIGPPDHETTIPSSALLPLLPNRNPVRDVFEQKWTTRFFD